MNENKTINHVARAEKRLRRCLERHGRGTQGYLYHSACGPHYTVSREQFAAIVTKVSEEGVAEIMSGTRPDTLWIVRKDLVEDTIAAGVIV